MHAQCDFRRGVREGTLALAALFVCGSSIIGVAQQQFRDGDVVKRLDTGTTLTVRTNQNINSERADQRVFTGIVDQDVRSADGRLVIPRGSEVELMARVARDNDLLLDLDSVTVRGQRYALDTNTKRLDANDRGIVGSIVNAFTGSEGTVINVPRDSVLTFRLTRPLDVGVPDRGYTRDGFHYHRDYRGEEGNR